MSHSNGNGFQSQFDEQFSDSGNDHPMNQHGSDQWSGEASSLFEGLDMDNSNLLSPSIQSHEAWRYPQTNQMNRHGTNSLDGAMNIDPNPHSNQHGNEDLREALLRDPGNSYTSISVPNPEPTSNQNPNPPQSLPNGMPFSTQAPASSSSSMNGNNSSAVNINKPLTSNTSQPGPSKAPPVASKPPAKSSTSSSSNSRRSSPSPIDIVNKIKAGIPPSVLQKTVNDLLAKLDVSTPTSSEDSTPLRQTGPSERKELIDKFNKSGSETYLKLILNDSRGRALFSSWLSDATPGKDETESKSKWVGTLVPLLRLLHSLPMTLDQLSDREAGLGKKMKSLKRRPAIGDAAMKLVDMVLAKWEKLVQTATKSAPEKRPSESDEVPSKASKLAKSSSSETAASKKKATSDASKTAKPSATSASKVTSKPSASSNSKAASKPAVQSDSSFFGSSTSKPAASTVSTKRGPSTSTSTAPASKRVTSDPKKKAGANLLDNLLSGPTSASSKPVVKEESPSPMVVDGASKKAKKSVRWRPDDELEQIRIFNSEIEEIHEMSNENQKFSETSEGEMLEEAKGEMIEEQDWFEPIEIEVEDFGYLPKGDSSREIEIQQEREAKVSAVEYESKMEIPETPGSPEPEALALYQEIDESLIKEIPLDDSVAPFDIPPEGVSSEAQRLAAVLQTLGGTSAAEAFNALPTEQQNQIQHLRSYEAQRQYGNQPINPAASANSSAAAPGAVSLDHFGINSSALSSLASLLGGGVVQQAQPQSQPQFQPQFQAPPQQSNPSTWAQQQQQGFGGPSQSRIRPQGFHGPAREETGRGRGRGGTRRSGKVCKFFKSARGCHKPNCEFVHER